MELAFALVLAVAAPAWPSASASRSAAALCIASASGAKSRRLGGFVWGESRFVTAGGLLLGTAAAVGLSEMRVKVLTGVFDPPPDALAVPWSYLTAVVGLTAVAVAAAGAGALRALNRPAILTSGGSSPRVPVGTLTAGVLRPPRPSYVQGNRSSHSSAP